MTIAIISDTLRDAARRAMPKIQARRFEEVLAQLEGKRRRGRHLATPDLPPITLNARFRPSRAKPRELPDQRQGRLL